MTSLHPLLPSSRFARAIAWLSAVLVAVLSLGSASPTLHAWLHGRVAAGTHACPHHSAAADEAAVPADVAHECAVTLFSQGVMTEAMGTVTRPCEGVRRSVDRHAVGRPVLVPPRYLHQPPQAPPPV